MTILTWFFRIICGVILASAIWKVVDALFFHASLSSAVGFVMFDGFVILEWSRFERSILKEKRNNLERDLLERCEWAGSSCGGRGDCLFCGGSPTSMHERKCPMAKALDRRTRRAS